MAQLRDSRTSALIAEGTPLEMVTLADQLQKDSYLFDDVGLGFNPDEVRRARQEELDSLRAAAESTKDPVILDSVNSTIAEREDRLAVGRSKVQAAKQAQSDAIEASMLAEAEENRKQVTM